MKRYTLSIVLACCDVFLLIAVAMFSLFLRFDALVFNEYFWRMFYSLPVFVAWHLVFLQRMHLYTSVWRYAGMRELRSVLAAATGAAVSFWACMQFAGVVLPRSIYLLNYILAAGALGMERMILRYLEFYHKKSNVSEERTPVLIIGAGDAGAMTARELIHGKRRRYKVIGFIDDDVSRQGFLVSGLPILGTREDLPSLVRKHRIQEVIIAMPSVRGKVVQETVQICTDLHCKINILPSIYQMLNHEVTFDKIRPIEVEDLLEREPVRLDFESIAGYLHGRRVLISGAGGSIGSELCRQVLRMKPAQLILLGHGENSIYTIYHELQVHVDTDILLPVIASVRDQSMLERIFARYQPQVVFHAAAHKHVPLMELQPMAAVLNNIQGTKKLAETAGKYGAEAFVMISTDKAVNPTNAMGATKQVAEKIVQVMNQRYATKYITVRFGNVLGSRGSVVPRFKQQLAAGGPITVTDPEMTRYFMTIPEAAQLVLQAGAMGKGGEIFLLNMGEPVKIVDLARNMIRLAGMEPDKDIKIKYIGLRPGEKLYEELLTAAEGTLQTKHEKIFIARPEAVDEECLMRQLARFKQCETDEAVIRLLQEIIPTYYPNHKIDSLYSEGEAV